MQIRETSRKTDQKASVFGKTEPEVLSVGLCFQLAWCFLSPHR